MDLIFERALGLDPRLASTSPDGGDDRVLAAPVAIGAPCTFIGGQFKGHTIRVSISELQKADVGRKFANKDRRPLDPPPTVKLQLFRVYDPGTPLQREAEFEDYDEFHPEGWICHVDLFSIRPPTNMAATALRRPIASSALEPIEVEVRAPAFSQHHTPLPASASPAHNTHVPLPPAKGTDGALAPTSLGKKYTSELAGSTFVQGYKLALSGRKALLFSFADLSVKAEGDYVLRYRVFDVLSIAAGPAPRPVLAECVGGPFHVYGTKEFPGLAASTELTKAMAVAGVRVNTREAERKGHSRPTKRKAEES